MTEIYTSYIFYYSLEKDYLNWCDIEMVFDKEIDPEILRRAVQDSLARYPYMTEKLAIRDERYVLEKNEKAVYVYSFDEKPHALFGTKNNDYMFRFAIKKQVMHALFFHGLCDMKGFEPFLKTVLFEYFNRTENRLHIVKDAGCYTRGMQRKKPGERGARSGRSLCRNE